MAEMVLYVAGMGAPEWLLVRIYTCIQAWMHAAKRLASCVSSLNIMVNIVGLLLFNTRQAGLASASAAAAAADKRLLALIALLSGEFRLRGQQDNYLFLPPIRKC